MKSNDSTRKPQDCDKEIGRQLTRCRIASGLSQTLLAERLSITPQQLHKYEAGTNRLSVSRLLTVARVLEIHPVQLLPAPTEADESQLSTLRTDLALMRDFQDIKSPAQRDALRKLVHTLATQGS